MLIYICDSLCSYTHIYINITIHAYVYILYICACNVAAKMLGIYMRIRKYA